MFLRLAAEEGLVERRLCCSVSTKGGGQDYGMGLLERLDLTEGGNRSWQGKAYSASA